MGKKGTIFMVLGALLLVVGVIFLLMYAIGTGNSKFEDDQLVSPGQSWTIGGKSATKITGEYSSSQPLIITVSTDTTGTSDVEILETSSTEGKIDYETPDSSKEYYIHFTNIGSSSADVHVDIEFYSPIGLICLIPGIILLALGILFLLLGIKFKKQPDTLPTPYPQQPGYQPQPQYQQPPQYPPQQYPPPPTQPSQPQTTSYTCPHCGKPFTTQIPQQAMVVGCPSCGGQTTIGPR